MHSACAYQARVAAGLIAIGFDWRPQALLHQGRPFRAMQVKSQAFNLGSILALIRLPGALPQTEALPIS